MPKLIMTKGLPASGKSTWARHLVWLNKGATKRICKDDLRSMIDAGEWSHANEDLILKARDHLVMLYLLQGKDVVVDDTNLAPKHEERLKQLAYDAKAEFEVKDFTDISLDECLERDAKRQNYVGQRVILDMWKRYLAPEPPKRMFVRSLPDAWIFDIDGTLALMKDRGPYDQAKCGNDELNGAVAGLLCDLAMTAAHIVLVSGRWEDVRSQTEAWLDQHKIPYHALYMRPSGDNRKDTIVKREIFDRHINDKYNVLGVFDDRPSVLRMWKYELGLPTFDVAQSWEF